MLMYRRVTKRGVRVTSQVPFNKRSGWDFGPTHVFLSWRMWSRKSIGEVQR